MVEQRRIELLEEALAPRTADLVAYLGEAVKTRNGAWQYALMDENLRAQYLEEFESKLQPGFPVPGWKSIGYPVNLRMRRVM